VVRVSAQRSFVLPAAGKVGNRLELTEDEATRRQGAPLLDAPLERSELPVRKSFRVLDLQTFEQFLARAIRLGLEPKNDAWPDCFERISSCPPMSNWFGTSAMGRAGVPVLPRRGQAPKKAIKVSVSVGQDVNRPA